MLLKQITKSWFRCSFIAVKTASDLCILKLYVYWASVSLVWLLKHVNNYVCQYTVTVETDHHFLECKWKKPTLLARPLHRLLLWMAITLWSTQRKWLHTGPLSHTTNIPPMAFTLVANHGQYKSLQTLTLWVQWYLMSQGTDKMWIWPVKKRHQKTQNVWCGHGYQFSISRRETQCDHRCSRLSGVCPGGDEDTVTRLLHQCSWNHMLQFLTVPHSYRIRLVTQQESWFTQILLYIIGGLKWLA